MSNDLNPELQKVRDDILLRAETRIKATAYEHCTVLLFEDQKLSDYLFKAVKTNHASEVSIIGKEKAKQICNDIANFIQNI